MESYQVRGGKELIGEVSVSGAKNVALKAMVAACLTTDEVIIENIPRISDLFAMVDIIKKLGGEVKIENHTAYVHANKFIGSKISLDDASHTRTSSMFLAPLLARAGKAVIPNPGGCRLGARPIDRTVNGLRQMGARINYNSEDGYFYADIDGQFQGTTYTFEKNTHTGTETLLIAAAVSEGKTILKNAAEEPEVDELIEFLNSMGAHIQRPEPRVIEIQGVDKLHGTTLRIQPDRNEIVTFAAAALITEGDIFIKEVKKSHVREFLEKVEEAGGGVEEKNNGIRFYYKSQLSATNIMTKPYPGFMTDWQAPWAVLMTRAKGVSIIHETVFESRFGYVHELKKMGANITLFKPSVENPEEIYNFNPEDDSNEFFHAARINGPVHLHNAVVNITDLRAGATLVIAALAAKGETVIHGIEIIKRGYENFDERLRRLGADITVLTE
ncbi:MAG: UDP-N-acetylglucosamine 1-carboxyvinyltransferase [Candidatus Levybacteria bacterium]|nr:UDP-N-acetylglucosamine 1-carboxyvinyltransferase [Candidatus Levybacteria bacterium]